MRELIVTGLKEKKLKEALRFYTEGKISLWRAARLAEVSLWRMMEIVAERKILAQYGERELREDLIELG